MGFWLVIAVAILCFFGLCHLLARKKVSHWRKNPSSYSFDFLVQTPAGKEQFVETNDGTKLRCISVGQGRDVVLAHGYGMSLKVWNTVWQRLTDLGYRVIAFDHRGHGKTINGSEGVNVDVMASDYLAIMEFYNVKNGILVGHSMSSFLAIKALLKFPVLSAEYLDGMVMLSATAGEGLRGAPQNRLQAPLLKLGILKLLSSSRTYGSLFGASVFGTEPNGVEIDAFNSLFFDHDYRVTESVVRSLCNESHYSELHQIDIPCVVLSGTKDRTTPAWHATTLGEKIPNARNEWVEGKGHMLNWEAPDRLVDAIQSL